MRNISKVVWILGMLVLVAPNAVPKPRAASGDDRNSIVIVFTDGSRQSFPLADIARIEFSASARGATTTRRGGFSGEWKVGDGAGGTFVITLKPDGAAEKSMGSRHGTWTVVNGEARIGWDDGWHDAIRKVGRKYQKVAFSPGKSFSDDPSNVAEAVYTEPH